MVTLVSLSDESMSYLLLYTNVNLLMFKGKHIVSEHWERCHMTQTAAYLN